MDRRNFLKASLTTAALRTAGPSNVLHALTRAASRPPVLQVRGLEIVDGDKPVRLRGVNLGGWNDIEDYMIGLPWTEWKIREQFKRVLGPEKYAAFFDTYEEIYIAEPDIAFLAKQGFNFARLPLNYRHFEDDLAPGVWIEKGFQQLDRVVNLCRKYGIWVMLDFQALPGAQARDQNAGSAYGETYLWYHKEFLDRTVALWGEIARRYSGDPIVAGYNPICEPVSPDPELLNQLYLDILRAIRKSDPHHIVMLDPNRWASDIQSLHDVLFADPQVITVTHYYFQDDPRFNTLKAYPGVANGKTIDRSTLEQALAGSYDRKRIPRPCLLSEFGVMHSDTDPQPYSVAIDIARDLISMVEEKGWGWALWCYKDLKQMGLVTPRKDTPWRTFLDSPEVATIMQTYTALEAPFIKEVDRLLAATDVEKDTREQWAREISRDFDVPHLDFVLRRLAAHSASQLADMARSFAFANCEIHEDQLGLLKEFLPAK